MKINLVANEEKTVGRDVPQLENCIELVKNQIVQCAIRQNFTLAEWERKKCILYVALHNCLGDFEN